MKSGSLNLLEPSGPVQAFTGIVLPLPLRSSSRDVGEVISKKLHRSGHTNQTWRETAIEGLQKVRWRRQISEETEGTLTLSFYLTSEL